MGINIRFERKRTLKDDELLERVQKITQGMGTKWCNHSDSCEGSGFVEESVFFVRHNLILWIVVLCDGKVAFIEFTPDARTPNATKKNVTTTLVKVSISTFTIIIVNKENQQKECRFSLCSQLVRFS